MKMLIKIASRNLWRNKKRSLIIISAVSIGLWAGTFLIAFYNGMIEQRINSAIGKEVSHIQLHHPKFRNDHDIRYFLPKSQEMLQSIKKDTLVKAVTGRVIIKGMMASASGSSGITINGVEPKIENTITKLDSKIIEGKYFNPDKTNEIIISEKIRKKLKLQLHKKAILTFQDKEGNLAAEAFRVVAIYKTINGPYDESNVFVKNTAIDSLAGIDNAFNEIAVLLKSNEYLDKSKEKFSQNFPNTEIKTWKEIVPELGLTISVGDQMTLIFMGIILIALAFGIVNTMMMAVLERTREIGMLLALGMNKFKIFIMILLETLFLILAGCPIGIILAAISVTITQHTGIDLSRYSDTYSSFGYDAIIYPSLTFNQIKTVLWLVVLTALISALFLARRALKLNPAQALKK